jgi:crotonobetainyl-CoA:carnitine CoA-transferase CaiB-like acyl-CoA transferase
MKMLQAPMTGPHIIHRGDFVEKEWYKGVEWPIRLERNRPSLRMLPPKFSQHTAEVLAEFGYSQREIETLIAKGAVCGSERRR